MARLIDANALNDYVMDIFGGGNTDNTVIWYGDVLTAINESPTIDAVPVVRCSECKFIIPREDGTYGCYRQFIPECNLDDFCSYGERREGAEDD